MGSYEQRNLTKDHNTPDPPIMTHTTHLSRPTRSTYHNPHDPPITTNTTHLSQPTYRELSPGGLTIQGLDSMNSDTDVLRGVSFRKLTSRLFVKLINTGQLLQCTITAEVAAILCLTGFNDHS